MLYDTHKRYGQVFGVAALPVAAKMGMLDVTLTDGLNNGTASVVTQIMVLLVYVVVALKASMFGAEFPDLDSPGSTPSQKYKVLSKLFKLAGVKHRGKFSHDMVTQLVFWGAIYYGVTLLGGSVTTATEAVVLSFVQVYVAFVFVGVMSHLCADAMTKQGVWAFGFIKVHFVPVFLCKINVFGWKPCKTWFTTASEWNTANYKVMTVVAYTGMVYVMGTLIGIV